MYRKRKRNQTEREIGGSLALHRGDSSVLETLAGSLETSVHVDVHLKRHGRLGGDYEIRNDTHLSLAGLDSLVNLLIWRREGTPEIGRETVSVIERD